MLGSGLLQGLAVTAKNLVGSFHDPERFTTIEYPEQKPHVEENYRNFPFLVTENAEDPMGTLRCVACQICEKECPPQCIYIEKSKDKKPDATGKMQLYPAVFDIDISVCMSCQICVEVCPFDAIKMDKVFEIAPSDRFNALLLRREQLAKPNSYYHEIRPTEAADVDAVLAAQRKKAEEDAKAKAAAASAPKPAAAPAAAATAASKPIAAAKDTTTPPPGGAGSTPNTAATKVATSSSALSAPQPPAAPSAEAPKPPTPAG